VSISHRKQREGRKFWRQKHFCSEEKLEARTLVGTFPETFTVLCAGLESEAERQGCNARRVVFARDFCFTKNGATCRLSRSYEQKRERFSLYQRGMKLLAFAFKIAVDY